jgi:2-polyprenyl-3-methyl-5-hydroxy-6-metoxy-1,4-benzoquinol methylase
MASFASKIKKRIATLYKGNASSKQAETEFYTNFFIKNKEWNTPTPNADERLRWNKIESFLHYIKDYYNRQLNSESSLLNILDVGCGRGWLSNLLSKHGNVIGIEPAKPVAEYGKKLFPKLDIRSGTAKSLLNEGVSSYFDIIVCSEVIEHIPDDKKVIFLSQLKSLLKKNGFLILTTPRKDAEADWRKYGDPEQPIEDWLSEASLQTLLIQTGFKKHLLERISMPPVKNAPEIEIYQVWLVQC